jgi:hypothetical protein
MSSSFLLAVGFISLSFSIICNQQPQKIMKKRQKSPSSSHLVSQTSRHVSLLLVSHGVSNSTKSIIIPFPHNYFGDGGLDFLQNLKH